MNDLNIPQRIQFTLNVNNVGVIESPEKMENPINGFNVGQESVSETLTFRGTLDQTGNVNDSQKGRDNGFGLVKVNEPVKARVRDKDSGFRWVNRAL